MRFATLGAILGLGLMTLCPGAASSQQMGDSLFLPDLPHPAFAASAGPRVLIDEAHGNFHTRAGRFGAFSRLLEQDGFVVGSHRAEFTTASLGDADLMVIANALHASNQEEWTLPTPSAFTADEIATLRGWVEDGGALLLIADHMPFPGAAAELAAAFDFEFTNGFAMHPEQRGPLTFRTSDGSLGSHGVTAGGLRVEVVDSVSTFTGQAFESPTSAVDLLVMPEGWISLEPTTAWEFDEGTPRHAVGGWSQGAVMEVGEGRLAVFGEAAMFTAQESGPQRTPIGMNAPIARQNAQFVANLVRWLVRVE